MNNPRNGLLILSPLPGLIDKYFNDKIVLHFLVKLWWHVSKQGTINVHHTVTNPRNVRLRLIQQPLKSDIF